MIGEDGRGLTKEESTKSPLGIKISTVENSNCHGSGIGTESSSWEKEIRSKELFWRERVTGQFWRLVRPVCKTGLTGLLWQTVITSPKIDSSPQERFDDLWEKREFQFSPRKHLRAKDRR
jgi:hypothetical protein